MVIIRIMGGLGNQMYQYALAQRFILEGKEVKLEITSYDKNNGHKDKRDFLLDQFPNISYEVCTRKERTKYVDDSLILFDRVKRKILGNRTNIYKESMPYEPEIFQRDNIYLQGYWNCEKYYEKMTEQLRVSFSFPQDVDNRNIEMAEKIKNTNSVSIHIRRGDYLSERHATRFGSICTEMYYEKAIQYIKTKVESPHFFVFSDDGEFVRKKYTGVEFTVIDWNDSEQNSIYDMKLMSICKQNICANSTFSQWGTILNENKNRIRVGPLKHTAEENILCSIKKELWADWIFIDGDGIICQ